MCEGAVSRGRGAETHIDLSVLVINSRRLVVLAHPFIQLGRGVILLQRWQSPRTSLTVLLLSNVACFCLSTGHLLLYLLLFIVSCASLGVIHKKTGLLKKCFPNPSACHQSGDKDGQRDTVEEFKDLLVRVNTLLELCCWFLSRLYEILKWNTSYYAIMLYSVLASTVLYNLSYFCCCRLYSVLASTVKCLLPVSVSLYIESWTAPKCEMRANDSNEKEQTQVTTACVTSHDMDTMDIMVPQVSVKL
ncbi:hypothetical protein NP493_2002g00000 [Ridgeia piscesae]|uniref:Reticulon n=1 Tax=Ridgeia piscesae TaxID=27915 RepID=A0AAD9N473_RIDPI|nr:hypothetical protein NP493_2002g00000 [Ridgeia piscesae]